MARKVEIASGKKLITLPNGGIYNAGNQVVLTDEEFAKIRVGLIPGTIIDLGAVNVQVVGVNHGATAGTARPDTNGIAVWVGTVEPTNAVNGDIYVIPS